MLEITCRKSSFLPGSTFFLNEIISDVAWSSYGWSTTVPGSVLDACPGPNAGAYHAGLPDSTVIDPTLISGCALGI